MMKSKTISSNGRIVIKSINILSLIAAIAIMGLLIGCGDLEEPNKQPETDVKVTFNTDGGTPAINAITLKKGESMKDRDKYPNDPKKTAHYFQGWFLGSEQYFPDTPINKSITLKARWVHQSAANLVMVTFNTSGNPVASVELLELAILGNKYPIPTHPDIKQVFAGWFFRLGQSGENEIKEGTEIWDNISVTAKWIVPDYTVTFNTDGGTPATIDPVTVERADPLDSDFPTDPTKAGFRFLGWYEESDTKYENRYFNDTPVMGDIALKARWQSMDGITLVTVTFKDNHDDTEGFTAVNPDTVEVPTGEAIGTLPAPPARTEGWGAGMHFNGWNTEADGSGDEVDWDTVVSEDIEVYAQWVYQAGTAQVVDDTLVHYAPPMEISGTANDNQGVWNAENTENADGSVTYKGGAVRYRFPDFSDDYDLNDYDFFTVHYAAKNEDGTDTITGSMLKQFTSANGFPTRAGVGAPVLSPSGSLEFDIRDIASTEAVKGIAIQNISDVTPPLQTNTIKWTKVVFSKGTRVQINFVTNTEQTLPPITGVVDTPIRTLPVPTAPSGQYFAGWKDGDNIVTQKTVVIGDITLEATYRTLAAATLQTVVFTEDMLTLIGPQFGSFTLFTPTSTTAGNGYEFTMGGSGWQDSQVKFKYKLPDDVPLSSYTSIRVTIQRQSGTDTAYKNAGIVAGQPLPETFGGATPLGSAWQVCDSGNNKWVGDNSSTAATNVTFTIDKTKAAGLTGEIEFCIYMHQPPNGNWRFRFYDVRFQP